MGLDKEFPSVSAAFEDGKANVAGHGAGCGVDHGASYGSSHGIGHEGERSFPAVVLASQSPRRKQMLINSGVNFACLVPGVDEQVSESTPVVERPRAIASRKSHGALEMLGGDDSVPILACDTVVALGERVFGKPADADDARRMLQELSGQTHHVISGVSILYNGKETSFSQVTAVTFHELSSQQIDDYIATGEPFDKAGAYGIQGGAGKFVASLDGDYDNVVGMPLQRVLDELEKIAAVQSAAAGQRSNRMQAADAGQRNDSQVGGNNVDKNEIRKEMKAVRKAIPADVRAAASEQVCKNIMATKEFADAKIIAAYCAFGSELNFDYLATHFPEDKILAVPCTIGNFRMEFIAVQPSEILPGQSTVSFLKEPARLSDIPEGMEAIDESQIDLVLVPGLAFDDQGYRMGYGGGYYDNYLARPNLHASIMGTFFLQQHYNGSLPHEQYDRALPMIMTQDGLIKIS